MENFTIRYWRHNIASKLKRVGKKMRLMPEKEKRMSVLDLRVAADQNDFELLLRQTSDQ